MILREVLINEEQEVILEPIESVEYTFKEAVTNLIEGKILLVSKLEQSKKGDVLVRVSPTRTPEVTEISYEIVPSTGVFRDRFWFVYDLPLNVLSHYTIYSYDDATELLGLAFRIGDKVEYTSIDGEKDLAYVTKIFKSLDEDNTERILYQVSRDTGYYVATDMKGL